MYEVGWSKRTCLESRGHKLTLLPAIIIQLNAKFQLEVSENEIVVFFPSKFTEPLKSSTDKNCFHRHQGWNFPVSVSYNVFHFGTEFPIIVLNLVKRNSFHQKCVGYFFMKIRIQAW